MQIYTDRGWRIYCGRFFVSYKYIVLNQHHKRGKATTKINLEWISKRALSKFQYAFETRIFWPSSVFLLPKNTSLSLANHMMRARKSVYFGTQGKGTGWVAISQAAISLPRNKSPGVSGEGRGREKICHPKQLTPRGVEESPTGISTNDMKGRATSAIKKLWTSNPVGKMEEKGKALSWCMERKNHHAIAERSLFGLGWQYPWDGLSQCHEQRGVGGWNWFSGLRRSSPQKCRVMCWATTTVLSQHRSLVPRTLSFTRHPSSPEHIFMRRCLENLLWCYTARFSRLQHCAVQCIKGYC